MSNGCICCTVRRDLICIIESLMRRRDRCDGILSPLSLKDEAAVDRALARVEMGRA
jgi:hypothetical protein